MSSQEVSNVKISLSQIAQIELRITMRLEEDDKERDEDKMKDGNEDDNEYEDINEEYDKNEDIDDDADEDQIQGENGDNDFGNNNCVIIKKY